MASSARRGSFARTQDGESFGKGAILAQERGMRISRRDFIRLGGAGLTGAALLGVAGCGGGETISGGQGGGGGGNVFTWGPGTAAVPGGAAPVLRGRRCLV